MNLKRPRAPVNDTIIHAVARLVDDSQTDRRDPSHSDIDFEIRRAGLHSADPSSAGQSVSKAKRVRATLSWALENSPAAAEELVAGLVATIRANGGFRSDSPNFVGDEAITNAIHAFKSEGFTLARDGELHPTSIDTLSGVQMTTALEAYARRARRCSEDAALLIGTGKDLLEAVAAHILSDRFGSYPQQANFPTLLGQVFVALDLATPQSTPKTGDPEKHRLARAYYEAACAINALRNKQGTGHGRPWAVTVNDDEAHSAIQLMGIIAGFLLASHRATP